MHIVDGILAAPVLIAGASFGAAGMAYGLKKIPMDKLMTVSLMSAAFFAASLIHIPIGAANVHLILNGLMGLVLGWASFPAICVALILQALLFSFGGVVVLGVNLVTLAFPAVLCGLIFRSLIKHDKFFKLSAFLCGALGVGLSAILCALALAMSGEEFFVTAKLILIAHFPVMLIEAVISLLILVFIKKVKPEIITQFS